jgi:hypothetical protein
VGCARPADRTAQVRNGARVWIASGAAEGPLWVDGGLSAIGSGTAAMGGGLPTFANPEANS